MPEYLHSEDVDLLPLRPGYIPEYNQQCRSLYSAGMHQRTKPALFIYYIHLDLLPPWVYIPGYIPEYLHSEDVELLPLCVYTPWYIPEYKKWCRSLYTIVVPVCAS